MKKYCYFMFGMFTGTDGNRYDICIPSPFVRNSKGEAMKDENFACRFCVIDSAEPMLVAFANEHFESMNNDKMQVKCWVDKDVVGTYTLEEFKKNGGYIRQLKPSSRGLTSSFIPIAKIITAWYNILIIKAIASFHRTNH